MNIKQLLITGAAALLAVLSVQADNRIPAFPGAEGYGKWATG